MVGGEIKEMLAAIGDIHGCIKTVNKLIDKLFAKYDIDTFIFLGDFVDRGDNAKDVLDFIINFSKHYNSIFLMGNHEDMMLDYFFSEGKYDANVWFENGGRLTIKSFDKELFLRLISFQNIKKDFVKKFDNYLNFIKSFKFYHTVEGFEKYFFSHAGCLKIDLPPEFHNDVVPDNKKKIFFPYLWSREIDSYDKKIENTVVIHGHTPVQKLNGESTPLVNRSDEGIISINIDTGCVYGFNLSVLILNEATGEFDFEVVRCLD
ncbi:serine/threonine protein phosphatase [Deferribacter autotrophicus]|uniref:Serine/threonine protein phosphatase n=1 Tax=Deferribacter autotrophicus TaxID=500465 RepID=A0A5A8F5N8_9BACT|nr:metallophosphoesterase family protein [Deferribacter autotrophicus]KAA0259444.1 serine/threonine protein phosphatase [Deferribacter autotrophicus]